MDVHIASDLFALIDGALKSTIVQGAAKVMIGLTTVFGSIWTLQFTARSIYWLYQGLTEIFQEVFFSVLKMAIIVSMAFNVSWYLEYVVPFVTGLPAWMGGILSGSESAQTNQVDLLISSYLTSLDLLVSAMKFGWTESLSVFFYALLVIVFFLIGGIPFLSVAVGTIIMLKVSSTVILAVGPVFIAFLLFDQSRQWFWGWVSILGGFMLTQVLFAVVLGIEMGIINSFVIKNGNFEMTLAKAFEVLLVFGAFTLCATELPGYAASIMGGAPSGSSGIGKMLGKGTGLDTAARMTKAVSKALLMRRMFRNKIQ
jgi:type IV secretion system protein VirB6